MKDAFSEIIGFEKEKAEMLTVADMLTHREEYKKRGIRPLKNLMLIGPAGVGKTMLAEALIRKCRAQSFVIRRDKSTDDFINKIQETFDKAKEATKKGLTIVLCDDADHYQVDERNIEPFTVLQAAIDSIGEDDNIFVIATCNDTSEMPDSLLRSSRFDKKIMLDVPEGEDSEKLIRHYLKNKPLAKDVNVTDLSKMILGCSCADIDNILNQAGIAAAYRRDDAITMNDFIDAYLSINFRSSGYDVISNEEKLERVTHECGHILGILATMGDAVGFASVKVNSRSGRGGVVSRCKDISRRPVDVIISLCGKAAVEMTLPTMGLVASGCSSDLGRAASDLRDGIESSGTAGMGFLDFSGRFSETSDFSKASVESIVSAEMERYYHIARKLIVMNRGLLDALVKELYEKGTLLYSDIQRIRSGFEIKSVEI